MNFICPYCFNRINSKGLRFLCSNPECIVEDIPYTEFKLDRQLRRTDPLNPQSPVLPEELRLIERRQPVFTPGGGGFFGTIFGRGNVTSANCPRCTKKTTTRACPICHSELPYGIDRSPGKTIAIIGAKESGKSHYIAVLIQQIRQLAYMFGWSMHAMNDETIRLYETRFHQPLYKRKETIRATAAADIDAHKPLFYSLRFRNLDETITLVFFDTAGENLDSESRISKVNRYIYNAAGIILLLDPLQLPRVRARLPEEALPRENSETGLILQRTANVIRTGTGTSPGKKIKIPLALTFSKMDALKPVLGSEAPLYLPSEHRGGVSLADFKRIDRFVGNWVDYLDENGSMHKGLNAFENISFFGMSALGCNPQASQKLDHVPRPIRVEDPFLWILHQYGLLGTFE